MCVFSDDITFIKSEATKIAAEIENYPPTKIIDIIAAIKKYDAADYASNGESS